MSSLRQFIVGLKAWQVFLLLVVPMFISQMILMDSMFDSIQPAQRPEPIQFEDMFSKMMTGTILMLGLIGVWLWAIATTSNGRISQALRPNMKWFYRCGILAMLYIVALKFSVPNIFIADPNSSYVPIYILLHFAATGSIFYALGFTAKNLVLADRNKEVTFFDYSGPLFLLWLFPIGVWFVQPRINRISERTADGT